MSLVVLSFFFLSREHTGDIDKTFSLFFLRIVVSSYSDINERDESMDIFINQTITSSIERKFSSRTNVLRKFIQMGFDLQRFPNGIDEELICRFSSVHCHEQKENVRLGSICGGVLQDPVQAAACEHAFCQVNRNEIEIESKNVSFSRRFV